MGWRPIQRPGQFVVANEEGDHDLARIVPDMREPPEAAWSRACLMATAPELYEALASILGHAKHHFPEVLEEEIKKAELVLDKTRRLYEQRDREDGR